MIHFRKCVICGKKMEIAIDKNGMYDVGHYFGVMELPIGKGEYKRIGKTKICGKTFGVSEWTGKKKKIEYWECNKCYDEAQKEDASMNKATADKKKRKP